MDIDEPSFVHNDQGDRSAAVIHVDLGKGVVAMTISSLVCGISMAICVVCASVAWWAITENRVTQMRLGNLSTEHVQFDKRLEKLENSK